MKTRVNLLTDEYRPKLELLSLNLLLFLTVLSLSLIVVLNLLVNYQASIANQALEQTKAEQSQRQQKIAKLSEQLAQQQEDSRLIAKREILQSDVSQKQLLLAQLGGREAQKSRGFAEIMLDLAEQHDSDLWLTKINLDNDLIKFEGQTINASSVPKWVGNLSRSSYFQSAEFASAKLFRDDQEAINFILSTRLHEQIEPTNEQ